MQEPAARHIAHDADRTAAASTPEDGAPIVGIGASAGGLEAFTRLLRRLHPDTGCAFVLVQHLDANHPSSLRELLGRVTTMPVAEASDGLPVAPNRIYVIPPNSELTIAGRVLRLAPRSPSVLHRPIDRFLQSLADDCGQRAIGVVLSGSGSDGAAGLVAVRDAGGMTFAQEPTSAEFSGMPAAAAAAGGADLILAPEAIADELARIAHHPHFSTNLRAVEHGPAVEVPEADHLRAICDLMHQATGIDFTLYRHTTVERRIHRRLAIRNMADLGEYVRLLAADTDERAALQRDLLIGVTSFFRDPESFDALKRLVFPAIVRGRPAGSTIRIWVPGCSTGEEAYSILIALEEFQAESHTTFPVQVFASDINEIAIEKARIGRYPGSIAADVSPEVLRRHFSKTDGSYQVGKDLRERCIFSRHNLLDDPPFSKLDLISCRNVLIYLGQAQPRTIALFHYALVDSGFLILGRSETTHSSELFSAIDPGLHLYAKRHVARKPYESFVRKRAVSRDDGGRRVPRGAPGPGGALDLSRDADRVMLARFSPAGVLVDEHLEVLEIRGQAAPFLALTPGKVSLHLLKLVPDTGLFLEIEKLTQEADASGQPARKKGVPYTVGGSVAELDVDVTPLRRGERRAFLILFETADTNSHAHAPEFSGPAVTADERDARIEKLTRELEAARARLLSTLDEHQVSDEESQQILEDALSTNEELQSLSEELETAKEELQSTNEELLTVNRELEARNAALASAGELAEATVETVGVPLAVLDGDLLVRHVNAAFISAFHVSLAEVGGRRLNGGAWDENALRVCLEALRAEGRPFERREIEGEFPPIGTRTLLVSGCRLEPLGLILLTVEDVTTHRAAERALENSEERRRQSEKMETIGRLAGGIAHDFNNLVTVIIGNAGLVADTLDRGHQAMEHVAEISRAAEKAAALTDQLLSFSRRKVLQPRVFDLKPLIADFEGMLRRLLGERIKVVVWFTTDSNLIRADPAEIGRVVMNLCVNARDAMPGGGILTIETGHVTLDEENAAKQSVSPGSYVRLVIADTGFGMGIETRQHAFEPFFSTKDASKGAGLGLATVFGIVQQSGGAVSCDSDLGRGTRFTILLPAVAGAEVPPAAAGHDDLSAAPKGSSEIVLLVEDDDGVRGITKKVLERSGYVVLEARDGREGLTVVESHTGRIDLLICDVMMPEMSGGVFVESVLVLRPALKVLFVSGHMEDVIAKEGVTKGTAFLQKPYGPLDLVRKVREVLDESDE